jgi:hypothetical protein
MGYGGQRVMFSSGVDCTLVLAIEMEMKGKSRLDCGKRSDGCDENDGWRVVLGLWYLLQRDRV